MSDMKTNWGEVKKWFPFHTYELINTRKKVFCFHHAGGSAVVYRKWTQVKGEYNFICVELPGKGTRRQERMETDFRNILKDLCESIDKAANHTEYVLYGHSMGAALAFYAANYMESVLHNGPEKVIVAGRQDPETINETEFKSYMDDDALIEELIRYQATPKEILENRDVLNCLLPGIRKDYQFNESLTYQGEKIHADIIAHSATRDDDGNKSLMNEWVNYTSGAFALKEFEGSHFFVLDDNSNYLTELINEISI